MKIIFNPEKTDSQLNLKDDKALPKTIFTSQDGYKAVSIEIGMKAPLNWQMSLAHEMGHLLSIKYVDTYRSFFRQKYNFRREVMAWRIAKSIIKSRYWSEDIAINGLYQHAKFSGMLYNINWVKLKIIPLNQGIKIINRR